MTRRPTDAEIREEKLDAWHREETHRRALEDLAEESAQRSSGGQTTPVAFPALGEVPVDEHARDLARFRRLSIAEQVRELVDECNARDAGDS